MVLPECCRLFAGKQPEPRQHTDTSMNNTNQELSVSEAQGRTLPQLLIVGKLKVWFTDSRTERWCSMKYGAPDRGFTPLQISLQWKG